MGDCKDNMKSVETTNLKDDKGIGLFKRKKEKEATIQRAENFKDHIEKADEKLLLLIKTKELELSTEKGREDYNRKALALLKLMSFHLDAICDAAADYVELK